MKVSKPNITLKNMSDLKSSGIFISFLKLKNEIQNGFKKNKRSKILCKSPTLKYADILSVIICTSNRNTLALNAVASVLSQTFPSDKYEVIVVNNSKTPFKSECFTDSITVVNEPIRGLSRARNKGAAEAKGEYLLFIDDDAEAGDNLLHQIYDTYKKYPEFSIVGGQIFLNLPIPTPDVFLKGHEALWSGYTVPYRRVKEVYLQYEFPYGACFSVRHSVLDSLNGFPETYGRCGNDYAGGEETAICFAVKNSGLKIGINPKAFVYHNVSRDRYTKEHIRETIRAGILTSKRLIDDGYSNNYWNKSYINEKISILSKELIKLESKKDELAFFYKKCEYDSFCELKNKYY